MKAVILAAGKGTRLQPITLTMSKGMIPVANRPILAWTRKYLDFCEEIILVVNRAQRDIIDLFSGDRKVKIVFQEKPLGTGDALRTAEEFIHEKFILIYGDDIYGEDDIRDIAKHDIAIGSFSHSNPENYGCLEVKDGFVVGLEEKSPHPRSNIVNTGLYLLDKSVFNYLKKIPLSPRGEYEFTDAIKLMIKDGIRIRNKSVKTWIPITYPWNLLDANKYLLDANGSMIDPSAEIRPGSFIESPVAIGPNAVIGPNCFVRKHSSIGAGCKVGQAVEVKNSIIMENSYASHLSYVGDTIIGRNCNVGGATMFANLRLDDKAVKVEINGIRVDSDHRKLGGIVGDNVKFGVRATVMPGKRIWPNLLIPACHTVDEDIKTEIPLSKFQRDDKKCAE